MIRNYTSQGDTIDLRRKSNSSQLTNSLSSSKYTPAQVGSPSHTPSPTPHSDAKATHSGLPPAAVSSRSTCTPQRPSTTFEGWSRSTSTRRRDRLSAQAVRVQLKRPLFPISTATST